MPRLDFQPFDADNHYYEAEDAFTRHVDRNMQKRAVQWALVNGRKRLLVGGRLDRFIPNPTFDPITKPGVLEDYYRGINPEGKSQAELFAGNLEPIRPDLVAKRVSSLKEAGVVAAASLTPQRVLQLAPAALDAGLDILVIQGTVVSAEHVSTHTEPLNLRQFISDCDVPVIVGGCASYSAALHLMRTGALGVLVGVGPGADADAAIEGRHAGHADEDVAGDELGQYAAREGAVASAIDGDEVGGDGQGEDDRHPAVELADGAVPGHGILPSSRVSFSPIAFQP